MKTSPLNWIIGTASFGFMVVQLDVTIVNVALSTIAADLHTDVSGLQWVVDAYTLAFAVLLLSAGMLGDRFGSRRVYIGGFALFMVASVACGLASNAAMLITSRAVQGIGAALLVPSSLSILNHACGDDHAKRAHAVGWWTASGGVSIAAGPIVGGVLLDCLGWRSIFLVNLPICLLAIGLTLRIVPPSKVDGSSRALDLPGQFLALIMVASLTGAVIESGHLGLTDLFVLGGFILAALSTVAFIAVEPRVKTPMLPLGFFRMRNFSAAVVFGVFMNLAYYGIIFVLSFYLQQVLRYSPLETGLAYLPLTATFIFSNVASGWLSERLGNRALMIFGSLIGAIGYALLRSLDQHSSYRAMLVPFFLIPMGMGVAVPAMTTTILSSVERKVSGIASAVLNAARQTGGAIGVAWYGAMVAGDGRIVSGLKFSVLCSASLLLAAAVLAWCAIEPETGRAKPGGKERSPSPLRVNGE